ncbi:MAG: helix-turn-helix domain-containing protein [Oscillospiraceae bacterium]
MEQMKRTFKHLQYRDRIKIEMMLREKASIQQIADRLHVTYQTIWRGCAARWGVHEYGQSNLIRAAVLADIAQVAARRTSGRNMA